MLFNVPVVPDDRLATYLNAHAESFYSCYFSLQSADVHDGRLQRRLMDTGRWIDFLKSIRIRKKYLLMNSRVHGHAAYFDERQLRSVLQALESMLDAEVLDGVVFADAYYLQALSDAGPDVVSQLEAVPSINHMLDSFDRVRSIVDFISTTRFALPKTLILDRSLNRRMEELVAVSVHCREAFPGIQIELLANEGCLYQCPFKPAHDCHISLVNMGHVLDTHATNRQLGCARTLQQNPARLFKSPFIRPEDVRAYEPTADVLKICGRTLGAPFLMKVMDGYLNAHFSGNLMELMDAMEPTAQWLHVSNERLPADFLSRLTTCSKDCHGCDTCEELLRTCARPKDIRLE
jgi:collagenase-like PrtC family protease